MHRAKYDIYLDGLRECYGNALVLAPEGSGSRSDTGYVTRVNPKFEIRNLSGWKKRQIFQTKSGRGDGGRESGRRTEGGGRRTGGRTDFGAAARAHEPRSTKLRASPPPAAAALPRSLTRNGRILFSFGNWIAVLADHRGRRNGCAGGCGRARSEATTTNSRSKFASG
jgi:hypothetical protein